MATATAAADRHIPGTATSGLATAINRAPVRLDVWLWAARLFKTRSLARSAIESGRVEVGGERAKPARSVRIGDQLRLDRAGEQFEVQVMGLSGSRGPAPVAQQLYLESAESRTRREAARAQRQAERAGYQAPLTKPDRRARRLIRALGDIEAL